jgi:putative resolvase
MTEHIKLSEASRLLQVSQKTLRRWDKAGKLKTIRTVGGHRRIPSSEIDRLQGIVEPENLVKPPGGENNA